MSAAFWRRRIAREWLAILIAERIASVDRVFLDDIPPMQRKGIVSAVVLDFRDRGFIRSTETFEISKRKQAHQNPKRRWELADEPGAKAYRRKCRLLSPMPKQPDLFDNL